MSATSKHLRHFLFRIALLHQIDNDHLAAYTDIISTSLLAPNCQINALGSTRSALVIANRHLHRRTDDQQLPFVLRPGLWDHCSNCRRDHAPLFPP